MSASLLFSTTTGCCSVSVLPFFPGFSLWMYQSFSAVLCLTRLLFTTSLSAYTLNRLGLGMYLLKSRSLLSYLGMAGLTIGSSLVMLLTPYKYKIPKHLAWLAFNVSVAATLAPVMLFKKEAAIAGLITGVWKVCV